MPSCEICLSTQYVGEYWNSSLRRDRQHLCITCNDAIVQFGHKPDALKRVVLYLDKNIKVERKRCPHTNCNAELFSDGSCPWMCERKI